MRRDLRFGNRFAGRRGQHDGNIIPIGGDGLIDQLFRRWNCDRHLIRLAGGDEFIQKFLLSFERVDLVVGIERVDALQRQVQVA